MFIEYKRNKPGTSPIVSLPADDLTYHVGDALVFSSGRLVKATGTTMPEYFCVQEKVVATDGDPLDVIAVDGNAIYETRIYRSGAGDTTTITPGVKYTIDSYAAQITSTSTNGVAEVVRVDGQNDGDKAYVKFAPVVIQNITQAASGTT